MSEAAAGHHDQHPPNLQHHFDTPLQQFESGKLGMWVFLAQELLFFAGVFCAYAIYRSWHPETFKFGSSLLNAEMGGVNTVILICSSLTMAWAVRCAQLGQKKLLIWMLVLTLMFAGGFLVVKYFEYGDKISHGLLPGTYFEPDMHYLEDHGLGGDGHHGAHLVSADSGDPAAPLEPKLPDKLHVFFGIYFVTTGLHMLHVVAGMVVIAWLLFGAVKGRYGPDYFNPVDIVGLYWHLVDLIWIFLFPLLYLI